MHPSKTDILFLDGLEPTSTKEFSSFLNYLFPLAAQLELSGFTFKIIHLSTLAGYSMKELVSVIRKNPAWVVGMTTNIDNISLVYKISDALKSELPELKVILGGAQATFNDITVLKKCRADFVIRKEGDVTLIYLLKKIISNDGEYRDIKGLTFRNKEDEITRTPDPETLDLDSLPAPQYAIIKEPKYWIVPRETDRATFETFLKKIQANNSIFLTGRGCPYRCKFCIEGNSTIKFRKRDGIKVMSDLSNFLNVFETSYVLIGDDTFTADRKRVIQICEEIKKIRSTRKFIWFAEGRVDVLSKNLDLIPVMVESGLYKLQIGVESGSQKILDIYDKGINLKQIETVVQECSRYDDLVVHGNFILGNPGETEDTFKETIEFAKHLIKLSRYKMDISCGYLVPFPGTPIYEKPSQYGLEMILEDFENEGAAFIKPICRPVDLSEEYLKNMYSVFLSEITNYCRKNIWELPKTQIDRRYLFTQKYGGRESGVRTITFSNTYLKLLALKRYYDLYQTDSTVKTSEFDSMNHEQVLALYPLRLWDIKYDLDSRSYHFNTLSGKPVTIKNEEIFLWEMATGKRTIQDIISDPNSPYGNIKDSVQRVIDFYRAMENEYSIILRTI